MNVLVQGIIPGILIGGLYAIMSLGVSLSWGALKIINLAQFSFILLGGYFTYQAAVSWEIDPFLAILFVVPIFFVVGALLQWFFDAVKVDEFGSLVVTFGLFIMLQSAVRSTWSADFRRIGPELNPYEADSIILGDVVLQVPRLVAFVTALAIGVAMYHLLTKTHFGRAIRAVAVDPEMARTFGIDPRRVAIGLSGISTAISALAGVFVAIGQALFPELSVEWFGIVFPVVILGGLGNTIGALLAGVIVGVSAGVATVVWGPLAAPLVTFLIMIAALLFRPQGLLSNRGLA